MEGAFNYANQGQVRTRTMLASAANAAEAIAQRNPWMQPLMM